MVEFEYAGSGGGFTIFSTSGGGLIPLGGSSVGDKSLKMSFAPCTAVKAGQVLKGELTIVCKGHVKATGLEMYFRGKDETRIEYMKTTGIKHKETTRETSSGKDEFLHLDIPVDTSNIIQNGLVVLGTYKIPFAITLPLDIPPTMGLAYGKDSASTNYAIRAKLKGSGKLQDYQQYLPIKVEMAPKPRPQQAAAYSLPPTTQVIRNSMMLLLEKGKVTYSAKTDEVTYEMGSTASVLVKLKTDVKLKTVDLELVQKIRIGAFMAPDQHHTKAIQGIKYSPQDFVSGNWVNLTVPIPTARPGNAPVEGFHSNNISVEYALRVTFQTGMTATNPCFSIPIELVQEFAQPTTPTHPVTTGTATPPNTITARIHKGTPDAKVGINLQGRDGKLVVTYIADFSPFKETSLEAGMVIYRINDVVITPGLASDIQRVLKILGALPGEVVLEAGFVEVDAMCAEQTTQT